MVPRFIFHVPHASRVIPDAMRTSFVLDDKELDRELDLLTDHYTDDLFDLDGVEHVKIVFPISRLCVDPERFCDDSQEPMAAKGMGVLYERTAGGNQLRSVPSEHQRRTHLAKYYVPHHAALEKAVQQALDVHGNAWIIDCHSYPNIPLPPDLDQSRPRPDLCIGTDPYHTPAIAIDACMSFFRNANMSVALNRPYQGTIVPLSMYQQDRRVYSIMIEVNRRLCVQSDPDDLSKHKDFEDIKQILNQAVSRLDDAA